ncbi:unnamed protein product [Enterobius vermicularis]|uniref:Acyl carrier protein n=1 Tax=Enterobius vermicularis TaxID=51028 RepID=A0A0N4VGF7_ENTVE|nr:unnamed protein product [Enterobius vermicularis]
MLGRSTALVARRVASLLSLKQCVCTLCRQLPRASANRLTAEPTSSVFYEQKRCSQIEVFGPLDPPKQLTFKQVEDRVLKAIRAWDRWPQDKNDVLNLDANFVNDLGLDSLDHVEVIMALEDEFGFEIPDIDAEKMKTPRDIFKYICEREDVFE